MDDDERMRATAREHGLAFVDVDNIDVPSRILQLIPESVARNDVVLPLAAEGDSLRVAMSDPLNFDTHEKLRFILNRKIEVALAPRQRLVAAIDRLYPKG